MVNEKETERKRVADTDIGKEIQEEIEDLKLLLSAYKQGKIKENGVRPLFHHFSQNHRKF